jgi:Domain of Unknown Function (DUF1206)
LEWQYREHEVFNLPKIVVKKPKSHAGRGAGPVVRALSAVDHGTATRRIVALWANRSLAWMMRAGYVARGIVFLVIGSFALLVAGGFGEHPQGTREALELLFEKPFGGYFLWILAIGLLCFAGWRFRQAVFDIERYGNNLYGLMRRGVLAGSAVFYIALAAATARITFAERRMSEDQSAREWTAWVMAQPLGRAAVALIAAGFVVFAIGLAVKAVHKPYRHRHDKGHARPAWADVLGSFGTLTRACVFLMLGVYLAVAAYDSDSREAMSLAGVLRAMQQQSNGGVLLAIAALGLLAFGFFEIVEAAMRSLEGPKPAPAKSSFSRAASRNRPPSESE